MIGPMSGLFTGLPIVIASVFFFKRATNSSLMDFSIMILEPAEHTSPWLKKIPIIAHSTAPSRSASAKITFGDFPPNSKPIFFTFVAAQRIRLCPTLVLPVNVIISTSLFSPISVPTSASPCSKLAHPFGSPASSNSSNKRIVDNGAFGLGLNTMLFPAASAGANFQTDIKNG